MASRQLKTSKETLQNIIKRLPSEIGKPVYMYLIDGKPQKEIAVLLNIPIAIIKQRISRALYEIRKLSNDPEYIKAKKILYENED